MSPAGQPEFNETSTSLSGGQVTVTCTCGSEDPDAIIGDFASLTDITDGSLSLVCDSCTDVQEFGLFPALNTTFGASINVTCVNCPSLQIIGSFDVLPMLSYGGYADSSLVVSCNGCPNATTVGYFPVLTAVSSDDNGAQSTISLTCESCASLATFGEFPALYAVVSGGQVASSTAAVDVTCTDCPGVVIVGNFSLFEVANGYGTSGVSGAVSVQCTGCPFVEYLGIFDAMSTVSTGALASGTIDIGCSNCSGSVPRPFTLVVATPMYGSFASLVALTSLQATATVNVLDNFDSLPATIGSFPMMVYVSHNTSSVGSINLGCTNCVNVTTIGSFDSLAAVADEGGEGTISLNCATCEFADWLFVPRTWTHTQSFSKSATASYTMSATGSFTESYTHSATDSYTQSPTQSYTVSYTHSATASFTESGTGSYTQSLTDSATASFSQSRTASYTQSFSHTQTATESYTQSFTHTPSPTASYTPSVTGSASESFSHTPSPTGSYTHSGTASATASATDTFTQSATASFTQTASHSFSQSASQSYTRSDTQSHTTTLSATETTSYVPMPTPARKRRDHQPDDVYFNEYAYVDTSPLIVAKPPPPVGRPAAQIAAPTEPPLYVEAPSVLNTRSRRAQNNSAGVWDDDPFAVVGYFPRLVNVANSGSTGHIVITCTVCPGLNRAANFPTLTSVLQVSQNMSAPGLADITVSIQSTDIMSTLGVFSNMTSLGGNIVYSCDSCTNLATFGSFPVLNSLPTSTQGPSGQLTINLTCSNCSVVTLGDFAGLTSVSNAANVSGSIIVQCVNCMNPGDPGKMASFEQLQTLSLSSLAASSITFACIGCSGTWSMGDFSALEYVSYNSLGFLDISCTDCSGIQSFATLFTSLTAVAYGSGSASLSLNCTLCFDLLAFAEVGNGMGNITSGTATAIVSVACEGCQAVQTVGFFSFNQVASGGNALLNLVCSDCPQIEFFASMTSLTYVGTAGGNGSISATCLNCGHLATMGSFADLREVSNSGTGSISVACSNCSASSYTPIGGFASLVDVTTNGIGAISLVCYNCAGLHFDNFGSMTSVAGFGTGSVTLSCTNCSGIYDTMASAFNSISSGSTSGGSSAISLQCSQCEDVEVLFGSVGFANLVAYGTQSIVSATCSDCPNLLSFGNFSSTATVASGTGLGQLVLTCDNCMSLATFASMPAMTTLATASGVGDITLACNNCPSVSSYGLFDSLSSFNRGLISLNCTNCASLTSYGTFASLSSLSNIAGTYTSLSVGCYDCNLASIGLFPAMTSIASGISVLSVVSLVCSNCDIDVGGMAVFPSLTGLSSSSAAVTMSVQCVSCSTTAFGEFDALTIVATSGSSGSISLGCSDCSLAGTSASFASLQNVALNLPAFNSPTSGNVSISCENCTFVSSIFGWFPSAVSVAVGGFASGALAISCVSCLDVSAVGGQFGLLVAVASASSLSGSLSISCTDCPSITSLPSFGNLTSVVNSAGSGSLSLSCTFCDGLQSLATFPALQFVSNGGTSSASLTATCTNCSQVSAVGIFNQSIAVAGNSIVPGGTTLLSVACLGCPSMDKLGVFGPSFTTLLLSSAANSTVTALIACTNCTDVAEPVQMSSLTSLVSQTVNSSAVLTTQCLNCPLIDSAGFFSSLGAFTDAASTGSTAQLTIDLENAGNIKSIEQPDFPKVPPLFYSNIEFRCMSCITGNFSASLPIHYAFGGLLDFSFSSFHAGLGLELFDAVMTDKFQTSITAVAADVENYLLLVIDNVSGLYTLDSFFPTEQVNTQLTVINNPDLTNIDGITANINTDLLSSLGTVVTVQNNPKLCNINKLLLQQVVAASVQANAGNCSSLVLLPAQNITNLGYTSNTVSLSWGLPTQPTVAAYYQLVTVNADGSYNAYYVFSSQDPVLSYTVFGLSPKTSYTFYVNTFVPTVSSLLDTTVLSVPIQFVTPASTGSSNCQAGQVPLPGSTTNCTICPTGTFVSLNGLDCILCGPGTASNLTAATVSSTCGLCEANSTTQGSTGQFSCTACPANMFCPYGAAMPLSSVILNKPINSSAFGATVSNASSVISDYGAVFFLVAFLIVIVVLTIVISYIVRHEKRGVPMEEWEQPEDGNERQLGNMDKFISVWMPVILRTPSTLLRLKKKQPPKQQGGVQQQEQQDSLADIRFYDPVDFWRGMIGVYVIIGLVVLTAYQIFDFVENQYIPQTSLQAGTTFSDDSSISTGLTQLAASIAFIASPITCSSNFVVTFAASALPFNCTDDLKGTVLISFATPPNAHLPLSTTSTVDFSVNITAEDGNNLIFAPIIAYNFTALAYDGSFLSLSETIVAGSSEVLTGNTISIAGVAAEVVALNGDITNKGYTYSFVSSTALFSVVAADALPIVFEVTVPSYFLQQSYVENIAPLSFASGLVAFAGGAFAFGTISAIIYSKLKKLWQEWARRGDDDHSNIIMPADVPHDGDDNLYGTA